MGDPGSQEATVGEEALGAARWRAGFLEYAVVRGVSGPAGGGERGFDAFD